jgi:1,4-alpha-glucan branching enzyme
MFIIFPKKKNTKKFGVALVLVAVCLELFVFNFHHSSSYTDYGVIVPPATRWRHLIDTDEVRFGGQGRIARGGMYEPMLVSARGEIVQQIRLYLPARTAVVLSRI